MADLPTLRWGIIGTGMISSWVVPDMLTPNRPSRRAHHTVVAVGASSDTSKARDFASKWVTPSQSSPSPKCYGSYQEVYDDPDVEAVYIGTPHGLHKRDCLDAIKAGKHVLCEKAFTLTAKEAREVFEAARRKGVFVMEAMWTRFFPATLEITRLLHEDKVIGDVKRVFCDFSRDHGIRNKGMESRLRDPAMGAGSLLDLGVYSMTWGLLALDKGALGGHPESVMPQVAASQSLVLGKDGKGGVEESSAWILTYPDDGRMAILTSHAGRLHSDTEWCRIEGSKGVMRVGGPATCMPGWFDVVRSSDEKGIEVLREKVEFDSQKVKGTRGFYYEADAVAVDVKAGRKENKLMPWAETVRVMEIMDEIRRQGGARFPQDDE